VVRTSSNPPCVISVRYETMIRDMEAPVEALGDPSNASSDGDLGSGSVRTSDSFSATVSGVVLASSCGLMGSCEAPPGVDGAWGTPEDTGQALLHGGIEFGDGGPTRLPLGLFFGRPSVFSFILAVNVERKH
jgi:hypothetical protein